MTNASNSIVALIPARSGSKRVKSKNIRQLCGHPLIAYTIECARASGIFDRIVLSTESAQVAEIARTYGADIPFLRPAEYAGDLSADLEWITYTMQRLADEGEVYKYFSILRPTSPFRMPETICRAWEQYKKSGADSLRAVEKCSQHPYKMWVLEKCGKPGQEDAAPMMRPFIPEKVNGEWGYSTPYQALPEIYVQNASLEISKTSVLGQFGSITGESITAFLTQGFEGFDINTQQDWEYAEKSAADGTAKLVEIKRDVCQKK